MLLFLLSIQEPPYLPSCGFIFGSLEEASHFHKKEQTFAICSLVTGDKTDYVGEWH